MNSDLALTEAVLDSELRHVNFFNGRLLTGGDLQAEQGVQHVHERLLGVAVGSGVAHGLEVAAATDAAPTAPVVIVSAGLAVNRAGRTLRLACDQRVALTRAPDPAAADACVFDDCTPPAIGAKLASGTGYYVLTIAAASQAEGKAPVNGLGNGSATCNSRFLTEGVKFQLHLLNVPTDATAQARNNVAALCFGLKAKASPGDWSGSLPAAYGWETLVPTGFPFDDEVPLAVLEWKTGGLGFVKNWPVRRRLQRPSAGSRWRYYTDDRRAAEGEAMFLDFQDDLAALAPTGYAGNQFSLLPAGGVLPAGFDWKTFLGALAPAAPTTVDAALWDRLLRESFLREPAVVPFVLLQLPNDNFITGLMSDLMSDPVPDFSAVSKFAAYKVYGVTEQQGWLMARSPLGRLRIFPGQDSRELVAALLRTADGSLRVYSLWQNEDWPFIADDLPGGPAELWILRREADATIRGNSSLLDDAKDELVAARERAVAARKEARDSHAQLKTDMIDASKLKRMKTEGLFKLLNQTASALNKSDESREADDDVAAAQTKVDQLASEVATYIKNSKSNSEPALPRKHLAGKLDPVLWERMLALLRLSPPLSPVEIINGRATDVVLPSETPG